MRKRWMIGGGVIAILIIGIAFTWNEPFVNATKVSRTSKLGITTASRGKPSQPNNEVQIFSWWTAGGEANGLQALTKTFQAMYPSEKIVNDPVTGGGGSNEKAVLASRMEAGDPPETFQVHADQELMFWVDAGKMEPLDNMYKDLGLYKVFPRKIVSGLSKNGHVYAVPADVARGNVLWYNPAILKRYHLSPPKTMTQFIAELGVLKSDGVATPLAYGDKDQLGSVMLWENVLLSTLGPVKYNKLWKGQIPFTAPAIKQATSVFLQLLNYTNPNHSNLTWDQADQMIVNGSAAFNLMGDWAKAYFESRHLTEGSQFGWTIFPGTQGAYEYVIDAFGLPKGAKNSTGAKDFLELMASAKGQDEFNMLKGSIPARTDINMKSFDAYSKQTMQDFRHDAFVPSVANGEAANPAFEMAVAQAVTMLINTKNVSDFVHALKTADDENPLG